MKTSTHVVVWIHHGLGDVIMALPMLISVDRQLAEGSRLTMLVKSIHEERLLQLVPWRCQVEYVNLGYYGAWNYRAVLTVGLMLRSRFPDVFIAPHASAGLLPPLFARLVGAPRSVGPEGLWRQLGFTYAVPQILGQHKVEYYGEFARQVGLIGPLTTHIQLTISGANEQAAAQLLNLEGQNTSRWIVLAPGSSPVELHKRWPVVRYRELIERLVGLNSDLRIALFGSPNEIPLLKDLAEFIPSGRGRIIAQPNIELSLALLRRAALLVCGCTGAGHMGALAGTRILGIYGPTNPSVTAPFTPQFRLLRQNYACAPCYRPGFEHGCGTPVCMTDITVDQVMLAIQAMLRDEPVPKMPQLVTTTATHPLRETAVV
ncbi:putative ADP-heptose-LPS heptosyltransferase [Nitrospira defluvii]|uniref:Putative ADP-heptose-LPS heptosyltransferase n=1 Tax=Nitrospira defluvii TaxID=330214 RepID=D8PFS0_9BACT|nr:putative ADP-heptose-LPS heptosyltransferase [Nitrospira defluvii]